MKNNFCKEKGRSGKTILILKCHCEPGECIDVVQVTDDAQKSKVGSEPITHLLFPNFTHVDDIAFEDAIALGVLADEGYQILLPIEAAPSVMALSLNIN